jgi:uncharacterized membrane protein
MKITLRLMLFVFIEILAICFLWLTIDQMPANLASHFNGGGIANGFMSRGGYLVFMLAFMVAVPLLMILPMLFVHRFQLAQINIPNKAYWLSEANREQTFVFLQSHCLYLGMITVLFMSYIHWLLIEANKVQPPQLPNDLFFLGLGVFLILTAFWSVGLVLKFLRVPN